MPSRELHVWQVVEAIDGHANLQLLSDFGPNVIFFEDGVDYALFGNTLSPCHRVNVTEEDGRNLCARCSKPLAGRFWFNAEEELNWTSLHAALEAQAGEELSPLAATMATNELVRHLHLILDSRDGGLLRDRWSSFNSISLDRISEVSP